MKKLSFLTAAALLLSGCASLGYVKADRLKQSEERITLLEESLLDTQKKYEILEDEARVMRSEKEAFDTRNEYLKGEARSYREKAESLEKYIKQNSKTKKDAAFAELSSEAKKLKSKNKLYEIEIAELKKTNASLLERAVPEE